MWVQKHPEHWDLLRQKQFLDILAEFESTYDPSAREEEQDPLDQYAIYFVTGREEDGKPPKKVTPGTFNMECLPSIKGEPQVYIIAVRPPSDATRKQSAIFTKLCANPLTVCILGEEGGALSASQPVFKSTEEVKFYLRKKATDDLIKKKREEAVRLEASHRVCVIVPVAIPPGAGKSTIFVNTAALLPSDSVAIISSDSFPKSAGNKQFWDALQKVIRGAIVWCQQNPGRQFFVFYDKNCPNHEGISALLNRIRDFHVSCHWFTLRDWPSVDVLMERIMQRKANKAFPSALVPKDGFGNEEIMPILSGIFYEPSRQYREKEAADASKVSGPADFHALLQPNEHGQIGMAQVGQCEYTRDQYYALIPQNRDVLAVIAPLLSQLPSGLVPVQQLHLTMAHRTTPNWDSARAACAKDLGKQSAIAALTLVWDDKAAALLVPGIDRPDGERSHITLALNGVKGVYAGTELLSNPAAQSKDVDVALGTWVMVKF